MSFTSSGGADVVREFGGITYRFKCPTRTQVAQQIATWAGEDRAALVRLCDECKVTPEFRFNALREHELSSKQISYGLRAVFEFRRCGDVIKTACGQDPDALPFTPDELAEIASELWGFAPMVKSSEAAAGGLDKDKKKSTGRERDWFLADAMILHWYGCDPSGLTMLQYFELLDRIADIREMTEDIDTRDPAYMRAKLKRMLHRREMGTI